MLAAFATYPRIDRAIHRTMMRVRHGCMVAKPGRLHPSGRANSCSVHRNGSMSALVAATYNLGQIPKLLGHTA
jgi:hypothetical protein